MLAANGKSADKDQLFKLLRQLESLSDTSHHTLAKAVRVLPERINALINELINGQINEAMHESMNSCMSQ